MSKFDIEAIREHLETNPPTVGAVISDGVSERDLCDGMRAFNQAGCALSLIAPREGLVQAWGDSKLGHSFLVDKSLDGVDQDSLDLLFIPGGERAVASLSEDNDALRFISDFAQSGKPVAAAMGADELLGQMDRSTEREADGLAVAGNVILARQPGLAEDAAFASLTLAAGQARRTNAGAA